MFAASKLSGDIGRSCESRSSSSRRPYGVTEVFVSTFDSARQTVSTQGGRLCCDFCCILDRGKSFALATTVVLCLVSGLIKPSVNYSSTVNKQSILKYQNPSSECKKKSAGLVSS